MNAVILETSQVDGATARLDARQSKHVTDVLKKSVGDQILAGVVDGPIGLCGIVAVDEDIVRIAAPAGPIPPRPSIDLILALPRPKVMKRLWMPLASLGVGRILVIGAEKVEPFYFDSHAVAPDTYRPRLLEGLEQARDTRLPEVVVIKAFDWFARKHLPALEASSVRLLAHPGATTSVRDAIRARPQSPRIVLAIGPEGGWSARELDVFGQAGFLSVGMRDRALRTDTAVVALLALAYEARAETSIASPPQAASGVV